MKKIIYIIICLAMMGVTSCNEYLDQMPDDRTVIDSPEKVKDLLVSAYTSASNIEFCETMTDNAGDKSKLAPIQTISNQEAYYWKDATQTAQGTPQYYWQTTYYAIAAANHALEAIENSNSPEAYAAYKGEALLSRAYHHFMLVSLYSQRYNPATANRDIGIPYVTKPEKVVFGKYERKTIAYVFEMIQKDLEEGLPLIDDDVYQVPKYHFTEIAAHAFASRFYLTIGDWEKAVSHANRVLGKNPASSLRDWKAYNELDYYELQKKYSNSSESANLLMAGAMSIIGRYNGGYRFGLTPDIQDKLFNKTSVGGGKWLYKIFGRETTLNLPKFKEYFKLTSINSTTGIPYVMLPLFTVEEILFNRMEALVMLGRYNDAITDVNAFLSKRLHDYNATLNNVSTDNFIEYYRYYSPDINPWHEVSRNQKIYLKGILDLKQREFMQEGMRWFDIKRYNIEVKRVDQDGNSIDVLRQNDLRRAIQIPKAAIAEGLTQNPR